MPSMAATMWRKTDVLAPAAKNTMARIPVYRYTGGGRYQQLAGPLLRTGITVRNLPWPTSNDCQ